MGDAPVGSDTTRSDGTAMLGPWAAPTPIEITPVGDDDPTATGDLLELYFNRDNDIYVTQRASTADAWSAPAAVAELNTIDFETTPEVSYDGLTIYFASNRAGTLGGPDIWRSTRTSRLAPWSSPVHVIELSSAAAEGAPTFSDSLAMTLDTDRGGTSLLDIYMATRGSPSVAFETPKALTELNGPTDDGNAMVAPNKLAIYFDSDRSGNRELYTASRMTSTEPFGPPTVIAELASSGADTDSWLSADGRTLYFTSDRDGTLRLWQTTR